MTLTSVFTAMRTPQGPLGKALEQEALFKPLFLLLSLGVLILETSQFVSRAPGKEGGFPQMGLATTPANYAGGTGSSHTAM